MKIIFTILLSVVIANMAYAGDLGKAQADRILEILESQSNGSLVYDDLSSYGSGAPYLVNVSNTKFSIREVKGKNFEQKTNLYFHPRYELVLTKKDSNESRVVDARNLFVRDGKLFSNVREQTRNVDKEAKTDNYNMNVYVGCYVIGYGDYDLERISTCRRAYPTRYGL